MSASLSWLATLVAVLVLGGVEALLKRGDLCISEIYCHGDLLHTVQMADIYDDSKTFVDMKQRQPAAETLALFDALMASTNNTPSRDDVRSFVNTTFEDAVELETLVPPDFVEQPTFLASIADPALRAWASDLNNVWKTLTRKMTDAVHENQDRFSWIYVPNAFVVPGGRFVEFYYWDTYWIMQGILRCEMYRTARGMLENFVSMVDQYGFVPNGGRVYYLNRSQPPLLTPMVKSYVNATGDIEVFKNNSSTMEKEYAYWLENHSIVVVKDEVNYTLARYYVESAAPRPESYSEDYRMAQNVEEEKRDKFYQNIRSGAESGWDFSTRWLIDGNGTNKSNLNNIDTQSIIPVDLNAFLYWNAVHLADLFEMTEDTAKVTYYRGEAKRWLDAITAVLWHEDLGIWLDYDVVNQKRREYFFPSNLTPLFTNCYDEARSAEIGKSAVAYLEGSGALKYAGGLPTSLVQSGEQWDLPNAWPPLQHMVILGLRQTKEQSAQSLASDMTQRWVYSNYLGYQDTKLMYEKYDAVTPGQYGGGGEYQVQEGFGWTNGVIIDLLSLYGNELKN